MKDIDCLTFIIIIAVVVIGVLAYNDAKKVTRVADEYQSHKTF